MPFDRAAAEALAVEAARIFADGLGSFVAAAAAEAAAERCRLTEEVRELSERREHLHEELKAFSEGRARLAGEWQRLGRLQREGPGGAPALAEDHSVETESEAQEGLLRDLSAVARSCEQTMAELREGEAQAEELSQRAAGVRGESAKVAEHLALAEAEQQQRSAELEARASTLELLRSELAAGAQDEARAMSDLAQLQAELGRMEEERSRVKASLFQCSCELADFRRQSEASADPDVKDNLSAMQCSSAPRLPHAGIARSPLNQELKGTSRGTSRRGATAAHTPVSRSSGHSTPRRLHLEEDVGFSGGGRLTGSPGNAQMALTRARCDLATAQQRHGRDSLEALRAAGELALALEEAGEAPEEVGRLLRSVLTGLERQLGEDHLEALRAANNLAVFLDNSGESEEAEALKLYRRASEGRRRQLGKDHAHTLDSTYNLALFLQNSGDLTEAEGLFREVLAGCIKTFGAQHHSSLDCMERLVEVLEQRGTGDAHGNSGRPEERVRLCCGLLDGRERVLGPGHPETLRASVLLLEALTAEQGPGAEAVERAHRDTIRRHEQALGLDDPATLELTMDLAAAMASRGDVSRAEEVLRSAYAAAERSCGPASPAALGYDEELAVVLANAGRLREAEPLFRRALNSRRKALGPWHEDTLRSEHNLAVLLDSSGQREEAERAYREVHRGRSEVLGETHPKTVEAVYNLAMFLAGPRQGCEAEAVELLATAQQGLQAHFGHNDARTAACAKRLSELRLGRRDM